jgi:cyanate permease
MTSQETPVRPHERPGERGRPGQPDPLLTPEIVTLAAVVVLGSIMTILDATIVNVALPTLGREFGTSISVIQWVPTIYLLAFASVIPLTGWASERFGAKRVWLVSLGVFMLGSLLCGLSGSVTELIVFRVLQDGNLQTLRHLHPVAIRQAAHGQHLLDGVS